MKACEERSCTQAKSTKNVSRKRKPAAREELEHLEKKGCRSEQLGDLEKKVATREHPGAWEDTDLLSRDKDK